MSHVSVGAGSFGATCEVQAAEHTLHTPISGVLDVKSVINSASVARHHHGGVFSVFFLIQTTGRGPQV